MRFDRSAARVLPRLVLTASYVLLTALLGGTRATAQPVADHLKCFKVKDSLSKATYTVDLDGLVPQNACIVKVPAVMACVPTDKTNVMPTPPGGGGTGTPNSFFCYKVKCPKTALPTITGTDQFGTHTATAKPTSLVCAPVAVPTTTTTTSVTTTIVTTTTTTTTQCNTNSDCPPPTPICSGGVCVQCLSNSDCPAASCTGNIFTPASTCSANTCSSPTPMLCGGGFTCVSGQCGTTCGTDLQCVSGFYCAVNPPVCFPQKVTGGACSANDQCLSGNCSLGTGTCL